MDRNLNNTKKMNKLMKMACNNGMQLNRHVTGCKSLLASNGAVENTHLRRSRRPLSPRCDTAGFSWIRACRLACETAE